MPTKKLSPKKPKVVVKKPKTTKKPKVTKKPKAVKKTKSAKKLKVKIQKSKVEKPVDLAKLFVIPENQQSYAPGQYVSDFKNWFMDNCDTALCRVRKLQQLYAAQNSRIEQSERAAQSSHLIDFTQLNNEKAQCQKDIKVERGAINKQLRKFRDNNIIHQRASEIIKLIRQNNAQARRILDSLPGPEPNPHDSDLNEDPFEEDPTSIFNTDQVTDALRNYLHENIHVGGKSTYVRAKNKKNLVQFLRNFYIRKYRTHK